MKDYQVVKKVSPITWLIDIAFLTLFLAILFGSFLGSRPLMSPDEGRYVEIPREMVESGDYITPHLDYLKYFEKPPLFYWMETVPIKLFGLNEWALRLPSACIALLGCLFVYITSRKLFDRRTGILSALVLATSVLYFVLAHFITPDMTLTVLLSSSLLSFLVAVHEPRGWKRNCWLWAMYALAALATLTKGLIGIIFPGLIIFLWLCLVNEWRQLLSYRLLSGLLLFLVIAVPWHVLVQQRNPEFFQFYFIEQHFLRYFTSYAGRGQDLWFFPAVVLVGIFPWLCFLLALLFSRKQPKPTTSFATISEELEKSLSLSSNNGYTSTKKGKIRNNRIFTAIRHYWSIRKQHRTVIFLLVWVLAITVFFTFSQSLLISYALPVIPPLAILIARRLSLQWDKGDTAEIRLGFALLLVVIVAISVIGLIAFKPSLQTAWHTSIILLMVSALLATLLYWYGGIKAGIVGLIIGISLFLSTFSLTYAAVDVRSSKSIAMQLLPWLKPGDVVANYHEYYQDLPVYLQRRIMIANYTGELEFGMEHQDTHTWTVDADNFWKLWGEPQRIFVLMGWFDYNHMLHLPKKHRPFLYLIGRTDRIFLLTNHPL
ncbi:MAG TPA: glycosyltransferase family 39 protein [Gammaproteobacteria bacterium]|nr:glycosyltransferase family 39 protein [Gammaproteobacteria bacterium]